ncbi:putative YhhN family [Paratrimastix pyriformis]|uniref:YhhN family n=1 Tax=Paratrimastix pyriformis TaxID=342808 RepID=A0ABQ8UJQ9_9EUKA|nr:putative YhhN family [Paratrimastix pyriformis]
MQPHWKNPRVITAAALIVGALCAAVLTLVAHYLEWSVCHKIAKPMPLVVMIIVMFLFGRDSQCSKRRFFTIFVGLVFGAIGDEFLAFDGTAMFVAGLGSFTVGHLCYIAAYAHRPNGRKMLMRGIPIFCIAICYYAVIFQGLAKQSIPLQIACPLYIVIEGIVVLMVSSRPRGGCCAECHMVPTVGSILFMTSDALLAYGMFVMSFEPVERALVMFTYWMGQLGLLWGIKDHACNCAKGTALLDGDDDEIRAASVNRG